MQHLRCSNVLIYCDTFTHLIKAMIGWNICFVNNRYTIYTYTIYVVYPNLDMRTWLIESLAFSSHLQTFVGGAAA